MKRRAILTIIAFTSIITVGILTTQFELQKYLTGYIAQERHAVKYGTWSGNSLEKVKKTEEIIGKQNDYVLLKVDWNNSSIAEYMKLIKSINSKSIPVILWMPTSCNLLDQTQAETCEKKGYSASNLLSKDVLPQNQANPEQYINNFSKALKGLNREVYIAPLPYMNDNTYSWSTQENSVFKNVWAKVKKSFDSNNVKNAKLVWCPSAASSGSVSSVFPSDEQVDYICLSGINNSTVWKDFDSIFKKSYLEVTNLSTKPVIIITSTKEAGGDKSLWIENTFNKIKSVNYQRVKSLIWLNTGKELGVDSSKKSLAKYKQVISDKIVNKTSGEIQAKFSISIEGFAPGTTVADVIEIKPKITGTSTISKVDLYIRKTDVPGDYKLVETNNANPYNFVLSTIDFVDGDYDVLIRAYDNKNNLAEAATRLKFSNDIGSTIKQKQEINDENVY